LGQAASPVLFPRVDAVRMPVTVRTLQRRRDVPRACASTAGRQIFHSYQRLQRIATQTRHNSRATLNCLGFLRLYFPCTTKLTAYAGSARDVTPNPPVATRPSCDLPSVGRLCLRAGLTHLVRQHHQVLPHASCFGHRARRGKIASIRDWASRPRDHPDAPAAVSVRRDPAPRKRRWPYAPLSGRTDSRHIH